MTNWDEAEQRVEKAHELYERGRWEEALSELRAAIAINPYNGSWHFNLGLTYEMMERFEEAIAAYRHARDMDPDDIEVLNHLGVNCAMAGHLDESIKCFEKMEQLDASLEPAYCYRIFCHAEKGDHDKAEELFYLARQYKEHCPVCYKHMGHSLMLRGQYDRALWCLQKALQLEPGQPDVHSRIAEVYWAKNMLPEARQHFLEEIRSNPGDVDTLLDLGELLVEMGQPAAAAEKFRQTLELSPDEPVAHFRLGHLMLMDGNLPGALQEFRSTLRNDAHFPGAHLMMAIIYQRQGQQSEALYHANCELAQSLADEATLVDLGNLLMDLHQLTSAEQAYQRALVLNPQNAVARHSLAVTLFFANRTEEGIEQCRLALRAQPKYVLAMYNLALAYMTKRDYIRARYWLGEAISISPEDPQLRQLQSRLKLVLFWNRLKRFIRVP